MKQDELQQSLDAHSDFIPLNSGLGESLVATSEKIFFENASKINKQELTRDKQFLKPTPEQNEQESQNEFLEVGKWKKSKESTLHKDMETVKQQVNQIITQTRWKKKEQPHSQEEIIADQSIVPNEEHEEEEIQDQTQQEDEEEQEQQQQQEEEEEQEEEQEQQEQEQEESEASQQSEQKENQQQEQEQQQHIQPTKQQQHSQYQPSHYSLQKKETPKQVSSKQKSQKSKLGCSNLSEDDKTDAQSEMKRTQYLPSKWTKRAETPNLSQDPWKRKEAILLRIATLVE